MQLPDHANIDGIVGVLARASPGRRHTLLLDYLSAVLSTILAREGRDAPVLSLNDKLFETGLSSLFIVELKDRLERDFDREIPLTLFFTHTEIRSLVDHLLGQIAPASAPRGNSRAALSPALSAPPAPAVGTGEAEGEDVEALLLRKIAEVERKI